MEDSSSAFAAVVLTGGTAERLGGADKATLVLDGVTLLEHALTAVADAVEVVVVGDPAATSRSVRFVREEPAYAGPAAALLAGRDALQSGAPLLAVLAVDMPRVSAATFRRLVQAVDGHAGAFLADATGRRHLVGVIRTADLDRVRPGLAEVTGLALHRLLARLDLTDVAPSDDEAHDVDTWSDLAFLREVTHQPAPGRQTTDQGPGPVA